jgi:hypothetical protein
VRSPVLRVLILASVIAAAIPPTTSPAAERPVSKAAAQAAFRAQGLQLCPNHVFSTTKVAILHVSGASTRRAVTVWVSNDIAFATAYLHALRTHHSGLVQTADGRRHVVTQLRNVLVDFEARAPLTIKHRVSLALQRLR